MNSLIVQTKKGNINVVISNDGHIYVSLMSIAAMKKKDCTEVAKAIQAMTDHKPEDTILADRLRFEIKNIQPQLDDRKMLLDRIKSDFKHVCASLKKSASNANPHDHGQLSAQKFKLKTQAQEVEAEISGFENEIARKKEAMETLSIAKEEIKLEKLADFIS